MTTLIFNSHVEGLSTTRPLSYNGTHFAYWKARIKMYFQSIDFDL